MRKISAVVSLAVLVTAAACVENEPAEPIAKESAESIVEESAELSAKAPAELIIGSWVIDATPQREEVARVSPSELEDFDEIFRKSFSSIRETFHRDGRYEVTSPLGGPFDDRWELVSEDATALTIRSSGHSWVARRATIGTRTHERSTSVLTYTFSDPDHMVVTTRIPLFGEEKEVSYFFIRDE
jgi:hypothetical protein